MMNKFKLNITVLDKLNSNSNLSINTNQAKNGKLGKKILNLLILMIHLNNYVIESTHQLAILVVLQ